MNKVIACEHVCSGDCRRQGCNCDCGEFHQEAVTLEVKHLPSDYPTDAPSVDEMLAYIGKKQGFDPAAISFDIEGEGDRIAADYADAEPSVTE
jgi:hypothetical protein